MFLTSEKCPKAITDRYHYDAWGELLEQSGSTENNYRYTGEQHDPNLGFYYLRARYMDPRFGRFMGMDTWEGINKDPRTLHKYTYTNNSPVSSIDPSGKFSLIEMNTVLSAISAFATGWTFGSGINSIMDGDYASGFFDIGLAIMGTGLLAKAPKAIAFALKSLGRHRQYYVTLVNGLDESIVLMSKSGKSIEEIARWAVNRRNEIKAIIRETMVSSAVTNVEKAIAKAAIKLAEFRNTLAYGNKLGSSFEYLFEEKTFEQIIAGSLRTSDDITKLFQTGWGLLP